MTPPLLLGPSAGSAEPQGLADPPLFMGLGDLPGGDFDSMALGVSADGSVVVGRGVSASGNEAFRWTADGGMVGLGDLPGGASSSAAYGVSADGSVVVGGSLSASGNEAFRWTAGGGMVGLGDLPGGGNWSEAYDVSADGSIVVGRGFSASGNEAFRWTAAGGMAGLGHLPGGGDWSVAYGVSADGSVVVGKANETPGYYLPAEAFLWTSEGGMVGLGYLAGGSFESGADDVSADGSVVVGYGDIGSGQLFGMEAFLWTSEGGMVGLGDFPGGTLFSEAHSVSADGSIVVGYGDAAGSGPYTDAFIWDAANGLRKLKHVLVNDYGLDLTGWMLEEATDVSDDGLTIVGYGINPSGDTEAWLAVLPKPTIAVEIDIRPWSERNLVYPFSRLLIPVALLGSDDFDVANVDVTTLAFGPYEAPPAFDLTNLFVYWMSHWDVNGDGKKDLVSHYRTEETGIAMGDTEACLTAETPDATPIEGCDVVTTVPGCGHGFQAALMVPPLVWIGRRARRRRR